MWVNVPNMLARPPILVPDTGRKPEELLSGHYVEPLSFVPLSQA